MDDFQKELIEAQEQRSQAWRDVRAGKFTSSEMWKLMVNPRSKTAEWSDTALTYIETKVAEEITGLVHQASNAYPLVWGEEQEPVAKEVYKTKYGVEIQRAGFVPFTDHAGGTPDGYIDETVIEIKCPYNSATHISYLQCTTMWDIMDLKPEYFWQIQSNMLFSKRKSGLFISYDPRFNDDLCMHLIRFDADEEHQNNMAERLGKAIEKKLEIVDHLKKQIKE